MPKTTSKKKTEGDNSFDSLKFFLSTVTSLYALYQLWVGNQAIVNYFLAYAGLITLAYLFWLIGVRKESNRHPYRKAARGGLVTIGVILIPVTILLFFVISSQNILYAYYFEPGEIENNCWQVRPDEHNMLQGEKITFSNDANFEGKQSMRLDVNLQDPPDVGKTIKAQVDAAKKKDASCPGTWNVANEGRLQAWVCLPSAAKIDNITLSAEIFLQYRDGDNWFWNTSGPVTLTPGQWTLVRWDSKHDPFSHWRTWSEEYKQPGAVALGLEIKFDENSLVKSYQGPIYIDEFVITKDQQAYQPFQDEEKYTESAGCP